MEKLEFLCDKPDKLANILCKKGFSYNYVCKLLRGKDVKVDDVRVKDNIFVGKGSKITNSVRKDKPILSDNPADQI